MIGHWVRGVDPELPEKGELLIEPPAGADREPPRGQSIALPAAEKTEIAGAEERHNLVPNMRGVDGKAQAEAGEADVDRQVPLDLGPAVVEQARRMGIGAGIPSRSTLMTTGRL